MLGLGTSLNLGSVPAAYPVQSNSYAIEFSGTNDYATQPDGTGNVYHDIGLGNWSISFYIAEAGSGALTSGYILTKLLNFTSYIALDSAGGDIRFFCFDSNTLKLGGTFDTNMQKGQWYHIVLTCDRTGSDQLTCYVNKTEATVVGSLTDAPGDFDMEAATGTAPTTLSSIILSGSPLATYNFKLDEIAVWNKVLTAAEIAEIYDNTPDLQQDAGDYVSSSNLLRYYRFEEGTGSTASCTTGAGTDFSLINTPAWITDLPF